MPPTVWAVNVARWNTAPHTRVDVRGAPRHPEAAELDRAVDAWVRPFDAEGAAKVGQYLRAVDRARSLVARLLPRVFCYEAGCAWDSVQIHTAPGGRPFLTAPGMHLDMNLSHDGDWVVLAISDAPGVRVGVDVMELALPSFEASPDSFRRTMEHAMTARERAYVAETDTLQRLLDLWTYKEAYTKSIGQGLGCDFQRVEIALWHTPPTVTVHEAPRVRVQFVEVRLPATRPGGAPSQIALALDGAHDTRRIAVDAATAQTQGWLRVWDDAALLDAARRAAPPS